MNKLPLLLTLALQLSVNHHFNYSSIIKSRYFIARPFASIREVSRIWFKIII